MGYYLIADLDVHKYNIYHIKKEKGLYSENYYHALVQLMREQTGHSIVGTLQDDAMNNTSIPNAETKDDTYFEPYFSQLWATQANNK